MTIPIVFLILFIVCFVFILVFISIVVNDIRDEIATRNDYIYKLKKIIERNNK